MANFDLLEIFITVADCGNITRAAEKLYISQPAVSSAIKKLEATLGGVLLERQNKGVVLTANGRAVYKKAKEAIDKYNEAHSYIENAKRMKVGTLKIGTNSSNIALLLSNNILSFCKQYPDIEIKIVRFSEEKLVEQLSQNQIDFVFFDRPDLAENLNIVKNFEVNYAVVGAKPAKQKLSLESFASSSLVLINENYSSRKNIDQFFTLKGIKLHAKYEVDNYQTVVQLIKMGLGIGIVNPEYFKEAIENKELFILPTEFTMDKRKFLLACSQNNPTECAKKFIEILK